MLRFLKRTQSLPRLSAVPQAPHWVRWRGALACLLASLALSACSEDPTGSVVKADAVTSADAKGDTATTKPKALTLTGISPREGLLAGGETVDLEGTGFVWNSQVFFGEDPVEVSWRAGSTHLYVVAPPRSVAGQVDVTVVNPSGNDAEPGKKKSVVLAKAYTYMGEVNVNSFAPLLGPMTGGETLTVRGSGFGPGDRVLVGLQEAVQSQVVDDTTIVAVVPPLAGNPQQPSAVTADLVPVQVSVRHASGLSHAPGSYTYGRPPRLDLVAPAGLPLSGGAVTLTGQGLGQVTALYAGGAKAELAPGTASTARGAAMPGLYAVNPAAKPGPVDAVVSGPFGSSKLWPAFVYVDPNATTSVLHGVTPASGPATGGNDVWILATLPTGVTVNAVRMGKSNALFVADGSQIKVSAPSQAVGPADVVVETSAGTLTLPAGYLYEPTLALEKATPAKGPTAGGTIVTIRGKGLLDNCLVRVGLYGAEVTAATPDGKQLTAVTPPGPPGSADIVVRCGSQQSVLPGAFAYTDGKPKLNAVAPPSGATGGSTKVSLYGSGFDKGVQFLFDGKPAFACSVVHSGLATCQTPPHEAGTVAVDVVLGKDSDTLLSGYTYFNPTQPEGGTWGESVGGTLNVTVVNIYTLEPIDGATVQLGSPGDAVYNKYVATTDKDGQVVFSGPDVVGPIRVSAAKEQHSASSILNFDAKNVTLLLFPWVPPSDGQGGNGPDDPPPPNALIRGKVLNIDKYLQVPPTNCTQAFSGDSTCATCEIDADCSGLSSLGQPFRCVDGGPAGKRCHAVCGVAQSNPVGGGVNPASIGCQSGFVCVPDASLNSVLTPGPTPQVCKPTKGIRKIFCAPTVRDIEDNGEYPSPSNDKNGGALEFPTDTVDEVTGEYELNTRLDELAVQCIGGYVDNLSKKFIPLALGVHRHVFPKPYYGPEDTITGVDVSLNMALSRTLEVRVDHPQKAFKGVKGVQVVQSWIALGSDGYVRLNRYAPVLGDVVAQTVFDDVQLKYHPHELSDELKDATWTFYTHVTYGGTTDNGPITLSQHEDVVRPGDDNLRIRQLEGTYTDVAIGVAQHLSAVVPGPDGKVLLVGRKGQLWRGEPQDPLLFWQPPVIDPYAEALVTLAAAGTPTDATVVGQLGLIRRVKGSKVSQEQGVLAEDLTGVCHGPLGRVVVGAAGGMAVHTGVAWQALAVGGTGAQPLRAVVCTGSGAIAVGDNGTIVSVDLIGLTATAQTVSTAHLYSVAAGATGEVLAAGNAPAGDGPALLAQQADGSWKSAWPAGTVISQLRDLRVVVPAGLSSWLLVDKEGGQLRLDASGVHDESPERRHLRPRSAARLPDGRLVLVGEPGLWLGPMLTVPDIIAPAGTGVVQPLSLVWTQAPGPQASFTRVHLNGSGFPFWWLYLAPDVSDVVLPDFGDRGIDVFPNYIGLSMSVSVDRGYEPGFSINGFGTFDLEFGSWRSRASNTRLFTF